MKIGKYISELLYTHDSVILPGFGIFRTKYEPAKFIPEKKIVESPSKIADFSHEPKHGETPLVQYISKNEGKSIEEVSQILSNVVTEVEHALEAGNQVEIENVGLFRKDVDGMLKFEPNRNVNYLESYTGVSAIKTPEQKKLEEVGTPPKKTKEAADAFSIPGSETRPISKKESIPTKKPKTMTEPEKKERKEKAKLPPVLKWIAIVLIPILVLLIIFFLNYNYFVGEEGIFRKQPPVYIEEIEEVVPDPVAEEEAFIPEPEPEPEPEPAFDPYLEPPKPPIDRPVYFVIVGSFRNENNAQDLALELRKEGARLASVFDRIHSGFYRTYYGYYFDLREAESTKAGLDEDLREIAWILHR